MLDKIGHIKNPLTVIAMFAAIAEVSGASVLPFIAPGNQATYIWFLMIFPVLLVLIFFATLNFNHKALYAPSDWKDESNFFRKFSDATPEEKRQKLTDEVAAQEVVVVPEAAATEAQSTLLDDKLEKEPITQSGTHNFEVAKINQQRIQKYKFAEKAVIRKLSTDLGLSFRENVAFKSTNNRRVIFDAVAMGEDKITAVEVKLIASEFLPRSLIYSSLREMEEVARKSREAGREFVFHYVVVLDNSKINRQNVETKLRHYLIESDLNIKLHVLSMNELRDSLGISGDSFDF